MGNVQQPMEEKKKKERACTTTFVTALLFCAIAMTTMYACTKDNSNLNNESGGSSGGGNGTNNGHAYVDLGLPSGILWATCNVGAETPEEIGNRFAWGETEPKTTYDFSTYRWCNWDGINAPLTKYCISSNYGYHGFTDNLYSLLPEDDAATANWGKGWSIPSDMQWYELFQNTHNAWTTQNGVAGRRFVASNGNSLFLPASGYWCNHLGSSSIYAYCLTFNDHAYNLIDGDRSGGQVVRAVRYR